MAQAAPETTVENFKIGERFTFDELSTCIKNQQEFDYELAAKKLPWADAQRTIIDAYLFPKTIVNNRLVDKNYRSSLIATAALRGNLSAVKLLLDYDVHPDTPISASIPQTPLILAAKKGHAQIVEILIEKGANKHQIIDGHNALSILIESFLENKITLDQFDATFQILKAQSINRIPGFWVQYGEEMINTNSLMEALESRGEKKAKAEELLRKYSHDDFRLTKDGSTSYYTITPVDIESTPGGLTPQILSECIDTAAPLINAETAIAREKAITASTQQPSALTTAIYQGNNAQLKGQRLLPTAAGSGHEPIVALLLELNANPNQDVGVGNRRNDIAVTLAANKGYYHVITTLETKEKPEPFLVSQATQRLFRATLGVLNEYTPPINPELFTPTLNALKRINENVTLQLTEEPNDQELNVLGAAQKHFTQAQITGLLTKITRKWYEAGGSMALPSIKTDSSSQSSSTILHKFANTLAGVEDLATIAMKVEIILKYIPDEAIFDTFIKSNTAIQSILETENRQRSNQALRAFNQKQALINKKTTFSIYLALISSAILALSALSIYEKRLNPIQTIIVSTWTILSMLAGMAATINTGRLWPSYTKILDDCNELPEKERATPIEISGEELTKISALYHLKGLIKLGLGVHDREAALKAVEELIHAPIEERQEALSSLHATFIETGAALESLITLVKAIQEKDMRIEERIQQAIRLGFNTRQLHTNGLTLLHYAIDQRNIKLLKLLLSNTRNLETIRVTHGRYPNGMNLADWAIRPEPELRGSRGNWNTNINPTLALLAKHGIKPSLPITQKLLELNEQGIIIWHDPKSKKKPQTEGKLALNRTESFEEQLWEVMTHFTKQPDARVNVEELEHLLKQALKSPLTPAKTSPSPRRWANTARINTGYEYEDQDITAILNARFRGTDIRTMTAVDSITRNSLLSRLQQDQRSGGGQRTTVIPCNIGNYHWVGLLFQFDETNHCTRAEFINSTEGQLPLTLQQQLNQLYPDVEFRQRYDLHRQDLQHDGTSCGACAIENLWLAANNTAAPRKTIAELRAEQLQILERDSQAADIPARERAARTSFYHRFNERQRENSPAFNISHIASLSKSKPKSETELLAISELASLILALEEAPRTALKEALDRTIPRGEGEGGDQAEHSTILSQIRQILFDHKEKEHANEISQRLFNTNIIGEGAATNLAEYNQALVFDYEYLKDVSRILNSGDPQETIDTINALKKEEQAEEAKEKMEEKKDSTPESDIIAEETPSPHTAKIPPTPEEKPRTPDHRTHLTIMKMIMTGGSTLISPKIWAGVITALMLSTRLNIMDLLTTGRLRTSDLLATLTIPSPDPSHDDFLTIRYDRKDLRVLLNHATNIRPKTNLWESIAALSLLAISIISITALCSAHRKAPREKPPATTPAGVATPILTQHNAGITTATEAPTAEK